MTDLDERLARLPLFPLPRVVLLPDEMLPLHVFEPRYRELIADCLGDDRVLGVATVRDEAVDDHPPLWPEVGVGRIVRYQALPDGRSNILVRFLGAARIERELPTDTPYRIVQAIARPSVPHAGYAPDDPLRVLAAQVAGRVGPLGPRRRLFDLAGHEWVDAMARLFVQEPDARRAYLDATSGPERVDIVRDALLGWLAEAASTSDADA